MRRYVWIVLALAVAAVGGAWGYAEWRARSAATFSADALKAALDDPARDKSDDARRKPYELLELTGIKRGDKVLELIPGTGYFTRVFAKVAGPEGHVYAVWPQQYARYSVGKVQALQALARTPEFANLTVAVQPTPEIAAPEPLDLVFTSQNYHDYGAEFMGKPAPEMLNRAAFRLLKPGGVYVVIDHAAEAGAGLRDADTLHRVEPALVRRQAEAAGFRFDRESRVLVNPQDPLTIKVFDPAIRGRTSQFAYRFVKPR